MSEIKVNSIKGVGASAAAITVNNSDGTCSANLSNRQGKNLIINGAQLIAQRGVSSTSSSYQTIDRFAHLGAGWDEAMTQSQVDVAGGTTPYTLGFRKAFRLTNGNQTSGVQAGDNVLIRYKVEAQDIANSGWNYVSSSSNITLSFWVKSSVAQNFYFNFIAPDGTSYNYPMETGSLSANTWTKVTKTISGNSNLTFNNDNGVGLQIDWWAFAGTNFTDSGVTLNQWATYSSGTRLPVNTSTWYTTNDATFEITGVQLEVGSVATDFEHRSFGQELALCQRYFYMHASGAEASANNQAPIATGAMYNSPNWNGVVNFPVKMRTSPSLYKVQGTGYFIIYGDGGSDTANSVILDSSSPQAGTVNLSGGLAQTSGTSHWGLTNNSAARLGFDAEL